MDPNRLYKGPVDPIPPLDNIVRRETAFTETHQAILAFFHKRGPRKRVSFDEIAREVGVPEDVLHRHLSDLHEAGHIDRDHPHYWTA